MPELKTQSRLSPTSIISFINCPRKYFHRYIEKVKQLPNINLVKGSVIHKVLEDFYKKFPETGTLKDNYYGCFESTWIKFTKEIRALELNPVEVLTFKSNCKIILDEHFIDLDRKINNLIIEGKADDQQHAFFLLKPKFRELFLEDTELHCCGYIDRINIDYNDILTIGDYKTSKKYGLGISEDYRLQMAIYSLLYSNIKKRTPDFTAIDFLRYGKECILEVTPATMKYAREAITSTYEKTRSTDIKDYLPKENNLCHWCDFFSLCSGSAEFEKGIRKEKLKKIIDEVPPSTDS